MTVSTRKFSEFLASVMEEGVETVGLEGGANTRFTVNLQFKETGDTASRPSPAVASDIRYNTDTNTFEYYNGTLWTSLNTMPSPTTDNAIARYDGVTGALQNSTAILEDNGDVTFDGNITIDAGVDPDPRLRIFSDDGLGTSYTEIEDMSPTQAKIQKITASGVPLLDLNPIPSDGTSNSVVRLFRDVTTTGYTGLQIHIGDGTNNVTHVLYGKGLDSFLSFGTQNLGIGITNPLTKLHVAANTPRIRLQDLDSAGNAADPFVEFYDSTTALGRMGFLSTGNSNLTISNDTASGSLFLSTVGTSRVEVTNAGYVGINTPVTGQFLVVTNDTLLSIASVANTAKGTIHLQSDGTTPALNAYTAGISFARAGSGRRKALIASKQTGSDANQIGLSFCTFGLTTTSTDAVFETMVLNHLGNLGIGTSTPSNKLHVSGGVAQFSGGIIQGDRSTLTIAGGVITITSSFHLVDTEGGAATDDLDTINGATAGRRLILSTVNSARDVTLRDGVGNLALAGNFTLAHVNDTIELVYNGTVWQELTRSTNS